MMSFRVLLALIVLSVPAAAATQGLVPGDVAVLKQSDSVRYTFVGNGGYLVFAVPDTWEEKLLVNLPPLSGVGFDIPSQFWADGSVDIGLVMTQADSAAEKKMRASVVPDRVGFAQSTYGRWMIFTSVPSKRHLNAIEGERAVAGTVVRFHLAYSPSVQNGMVIDRTLHALLDSFDGGTGAYVLRPGETVRHKPNTRKRR